MKHSEPVAGGPIDGDGSRLSDERVLPLYRSHWSRYVVGCLVPMVGFIFLVVVVGGVGFIVSGLTRSPRPGEAARGWQVLGGVCVLAMAPLPYMQLRSQLRVMVARHPHVVVSGDALVFHDGSVFVSPQPINRANIERIVMGPGVSQHFKTMRSVHSPGPVVLSPYADLPNAVLTLKAPTCLQYAWVPFTVYRLWNGRPPVATEPISEVWIPFADTATAYRTLTAWTPTEWVEEK